MSNKIHSALEAIARRDIAEDTNLWPQITAHIDKRKDTTMNPKLKLIWTVALTLLALILATTAAYAVYRYFADPGLQAVSDAGLFTDVNATAQPTVLPTSTPNAADAATQVGAEQTQNGVTARLEWVSLQDGQQIFQVSVQGLTAQTELGMPKVQYPDRTPEQYRGAIFSLDGQPTLTGRYVSYQLLRKNDLVGGQAQMQIDIPLLQRTGDQPTQIANFHFDLKDVPVIVPEGGGGGNSYAIRVNGLEMKLASTIITPAYTEAHFCYDLPTAGKDWLISQADIQFSNKSGPVGQAVPMQNVRQRADENGQRCADVRFPQGQAADDILFAITVNGLSVAETQEKIDSTWQFYMDRVDDIHVAGVPQPAPSPTAEKALDTQTNGKLKVTLLSAYADANRIAITLQVDGANTDIHLDSNLTDPDGFAINAGYSAGPAEPNQTNRYLITFLPEDMSLSKEQGFSHIVPLAEDRFKGKFDLNIVENDGSETQTNFHFDLDIPVYPARTIEPKQVVTVNGIEMRLEKLKITPSFTYIFLCYNKPTPADWGIDYQSTLQIGASQVPSAGYALISDSDIGDLGKNRNPDFTPPSTGRCVKLGAAVGYHDQPETLTLTITQLEQSPPEVIPDAEVKKAQAKLKAQGIELDYTTISGNGGGGSNQLIKKKPDGMTDIQVFHLFYEALGYYHPGPWVFTLELKP